MSVMDYRKMLFLLSLLLTATVQATTVWENKVNVSFIKTVQLFPKGLDMAMPVLTLNSPETLELHFDDISGEPRSYYYTVVQCNSNWTPTTMNVMEYVDGFTEANINDYEYSEGTKQSYIHYTLEFPNIDMRINKSGNYILLVYDRDKDKPLFSRRFMITEAKVQVQAGVAYPRNFAARDQFQEVVFKVNHKGFPIDYPQMEIKATVLQNYRWDHAKVDIRPLLSGMNELNFDFTGTLTFPTAGREFRFFDLRSLRFRGQNIRAFDIRDASNEVFLLYDKPQKRDNYQLIKDLNGQYYIDNLDNPYYNSAADYAYVHFNLDVNGKIPNGNFYVLGAFNDWRYDESCKMTFDVLDQTYTTTQFLKQGWYNYTYIFKPDDGPPDPFFTEGYFMDTENDYTILLYYTPFGERYDRLIAVKHINSLMNRY
ncbi:MAG TPA: DUF5103 domain-containing protein [Chitinophagales bacterium]|nr:DUF5103 domain-containing protein [Chitinophagales bacterium]HPW86445.1 DUF5103 domain-containing protein [Chitinophagales bacterium]HQO32750.1 DUF5103 domain-containing protein [Chitinophagales bacterium]HQO89785.1 DUF5103 domain-containing protein [Chitinophagales bacterium]